MPTKGLHRSFDVLQAVSKDGSHKAIAVPSRLYRPVSEKYPLGGLRVSLKDNIRLAGTHTTMMNRAYNDLYGQEIESAEYAQRLLELGAVIVGKTKMCAFASAEEPTDQ